MATRPMGLLALTNKTKTENIAKSKRNKEERTPSNDFFRVSDELVNQKLLVGAKADVDAAKVNCEEQLARPIKWLCGCYGFGISANAPISKLIYAICDLLTRQTIVFGGERTVYEMYGCETQELVSDVCDIMGKDVPIPLVTSIKEIAKTYYAKSRLGGKEIEFIAGLLLELDSVRYMHIFKNNAGKQCVTAKTLFMIPDLPIDKNSINTPFTILANPIFRIDKRFVAFKRNFFQYTKKATNLQIQLHTLLNLQIRNAIVRHTKKECTYSITEIELKNIIATQSRYKNRPQRFKDDLDMAIKNCTAYGMILGVSESRTLANEVLYTFTLNKSYYPIKEENITTLKNSLKKGVKTIAKD